MQKIQLEERRYCKMYGVPSIEVTFVCGCSTQKFLLLYSITTTYCNLYIIMRDTLAVKDIMYFLALIMVFKCMERP